MQSSRNVLRALLVLAGLGLPTAAQLPRIPVELQPGIPSVGAELGIDCDDDLSAAVWVDDANLQVFCAVSDGRGVEWSEPLRVDVPPHSGSSLPLTFLHDTGVQVVGQSVYVTWREVDFATGNGRVLFSRSTDGGESFGPELELDDGVAGIAKTPRAITTVSPDPDGDHVYVLRIDSDPNFGLLPPRVVASHDGGTTFAAAVPITSTPPSGFTSRDPNIWADGLEVHVVWSEDTQNPDQYEVYYQRSLDGGLTWLDFDVLISKGLNQLANDSETRVSARGDRFFVTYLARSTVTTADELRYSLSLDGGQTWPTIGARITGVVTGGDMQGPTPYVTRSGNLVVAWEDDRSGAPAVYRSTSPAGGGGFSGPEQLWSESGLGGARARVLGPEDPSEPETVLIAFDAGAGISTGGGGRVPAFLSTDAGLSFRATGELDRIADADADYVTLAYSARYDNYLALWRADGAGVEAVRSGGVRPQTAEVVGLVSGGTARIEFEGFAPPGGSPKFAWALASGSAGNFPLPLGDGRDLGLTLDGTLLTTLQSPSLFSTMLDVDGTGSTPAIDVLSPPGTTFTVAAVALSLSPLRLEELTDAIPFVVE